MTLRGSAMLGMEPAIVIASKLDRESSKPRLPCGSLYIPLLILCGLIPIRLKHHACVLGNCLQMIGSDVQPSPPVGVRKHP